MSLRKFQRVVGVSCAIGILVFLGWMWSMIGEPSPFDGWVYVVVVVVLGTGSGWGLCREPS